MIRIITDSAADFSAEELKQFLDESFDMLLNI